MSALPWDQSVSSLPGIGPARAEQLAEMGITTVGNLLEHLPTRYLDASQVTPIRLLEPGMQATIQAQVLRIHTVRNRMMMTTVQIQDTEGAKLGIFFFRQPYIARQLKEGEWYAFFGKVGEYKGKISLTHPVFEPMDQEQHLHTGRLVPIYPQHGALKTPWFRRQVNLLLSTFDELQPEYLPENIREQEGLLGRTDSWRQAHYPDTVELAEKARRRLAFDELWQVFATIQQEQDTLMQERVAQPMARARLEQLEQEYAARAPFPLTPTQTTAILEVVNALSQTHPTRHIVQGEVGSGKTLVAGFACLAAALHGQQALYLAPTAILAHQHFQTLQPLAAQWGIEVSLWTSSSKLNPDAPIIVGTHALLHAKTPETSWQPAVLVVDEEHRFGVQQREQFLQGTAKPHLLSMTATPIPRTLAHILYGSHHVSYLEPIPGKERQITTRVFPPRKFDDHLQWLDTTLKETGSQAFLIAPLVEPSEAEELAHVTDATSLFARVKKALPKRNIALLTGRTPAKEKESILQAMHDKKIDILVATAVIEVGIDIPNAAVITICSAERFGYAQLHQLRGRVGRAGQTGWAFLMPSQTGQAQERLKVMETVDNGNQLAELDLERRGAGEFLGTRQTGWDGLRVATWMDLPLIEQVKRLRRLESDV